MSQRDKTHEVLESAKRSFAAALSSKAVLPLKRYYRLCEAVLPLKRYYRLGEAVLPPKRYYRSRAVLPLVRGAAGIRVGLFPCGPNRPCAGKTELVEAFCPSLDPGAQHINRGAGLAHGTHQDFPSRVPATLAL